MYPNPYDGHMYTIYKCIYIFVSIYKSKHLLNAYTMPGTVPCALYLLGIISYDPPMKYAL